MSRELCVTGHKRHRGVAPTLGTAEVHGTVARGYVVFVTLFIVTVDVASCLRYALLGFNVYPRPAREKALGACGAETVRHQVRRPEGDVSQATRDIRVRVLKGAKRRDKRGDDVSRDVVARQRGKKRCEGVRWGHGGTGIPSNISSAPRHQRPTWPRPRPASLWLDAGVYVDRLRNTLMTDGFQRGKGAFGSAIPGRLFGAVFRGNGIARVPLSPSQTRRNMRKMNRRERQERITCFVSVCCVMWLGWLGGGCVALL